jgi:hypothetical protein
MIKELEDFLPFIKVDKNEDVVDKNIKVYVSI